MDAATRHKLVQERYGNLPLDKLCLKTADLCASILGWLGIFQITNKFLGLGSRRFAIETNGSPLGEQAELEIQAYLSCTAEVRVHSVSSYYRN